MKICIVGEGPIGLLTAILFIYYKRIHKIDDLELTLYRARQEYKRRHIVKVTKEIMKDIERLLSNCANCLLGDLSEKAISQIQVSLNCLETILYTKIDTKLITIIDSKFNKEAKKKYDHVFLCDGYASKNRETFIYEGMSYNHMGCVLPDSTLLILYSNLSTTVNTDCITELPNKNMFNERTINNLPIFQKDEIDFDQLTTFIKLIYNVNNTLEPPPNPGEDYLPKIQGIDLQQKNIWTDGFKNYQEFIDIFDKTILYIQQYKIRISDWLQKMLQVFINRGAHIPETMKTILSDELLLNKIYEAYKTFLLNKLSTIDGIEKSFMIHTVGPAGAAFGIILDESKPNILYANKFDDTYYWLLGDSANAYPPGFSLLFGLIDSFYLVNNFKKTNFPHLVDDSSDLPFNLNIFTCSEDNKKFKSLDLKTLSENVCEKFINLKFVGGYKKGDLRNNIQQPISKIIEIINSKSCKISASEPNDNLINLYNNYQLNIFFNRLNEVICSPATLVEQPPPRSWASVVKASPPSTPPPKNVMRHQRKTFRRLGPYSITPLHHNWPSTARGGTAKKYFKRKTLTKNNKKNKSNKKLHKKTYKKLHKKQFKIKNRCKYND